MEVAVRALSKPGGPESQGQGDILEKAGVDPWVHITVLEGVEVGMGCVLALVKTTSHFQSTPIFFP